MDNPVVGNIFALELEVQAVETDDGTSITTNSPAFSAGRLSTVCNLAARWPLASLRRLWTSYYLRGASGEEDVMIPGSTLKFVIGGLLSFVEIKSQGKTGFPFQTHPDAVMVGVTSLLVYGLASAAEHVLSAADTDHAVDFVLVARLGRLISLYMLVGSLAALFYF